MKIRSSFVSNSSSSSYIIGHKGKEPGMSESVVVSLETLTKWIIEDGGEPSSLSEKRKKIDTALEDGYYLDCIDVEYGYGHILMDLEASGAIKIITNMDME